MRPRAMTIPLLLLGLAAPDASAAASTAPSRMSPRLAACDRGTSAESMTGRLWARAVTIMDSASRADATVRVRRFEHTIARGGKTVANETSREGTAPARSPFTSLPPASIPGQGYIVESEDDVSYYAPDLPVLLSREFLDTHCFSERKAPKGEGTLVGLAFKPERAKPGVSDIEGTFWFDGTSLDLRRVEFRYTGVPASYASAGVGGQLAFNRTARGVWMLTGWEIRMPQGAAFSRQKLEHSQSRMERFVTVDHLRVAGGEVLDR